MPEGTIKKWMPDRGRGHISPDEGGDDVFFFADNLRDASPDQLHEGLRVRYELRSRADRPTTQSFSLIGAPGQAGPAQGGEYRFLNPYNFIRPLKDVVNDRLPPDAELMGRCPPPPHDRWLPSGLAGEIECSVEAVTPLFISDSEMVAKDEETGHKTFRFYRHDFGRGEEFALPASSLRGMVRSVFEAVTNSCLAHFDYGARLSYHLAPAEALKLVPARAVDADGKWHLELLTGDVNVRSWDEKPDRVYAASVRMYDAIKLAGKGGTPPPKARGVRDGDHGRECWAALVRKGFPPTWRVIEVADADAAGETAMKAVIERERLREEKLPLGRGKSAPEFRVEKGYLCITNQNIEMKHSERFFFRAIGKAGAAPTVELDDRVRAWYGELIRDYQKRHADRINGWKPQERRKRLKKGGRREVWEDWQTAPSRFLHHQNNPELQRGNLVYARVTGPIDRPEVKFIVPVSVPRLMYDKVVADKLPGGPLGHLAKCNRPEALCPACRTFGWVYGKPGIRDTPPEEVVTAYASRVQFSVGEPVGTPQTVGGPLTLAILSSPKPTTFRFYLRSEHGLPKDGQADDRINFDAHGMVVRGRKVYRHQPNPQPEEYLRAPNPETGKHETDDQNRTVKDVLRPGARFKFRVHFENLAPAELGALLWSLDFGGRALHHRLGFGKPLGFGSLKAEVQHVRLLSPQKRYGTLTVDGWEPPLTGIEARQRWVGQFEAALSQAHAREAGAFDELPNVKDLCALLGESAALPIHYPRTSLRPNFKGENFKWFVNNNNPSRGHRLTLPIAPDDTKGFPLTPIEEKRRSENRPGSKDPRRRG